MKKSTKAKSRKDAYEICLAFQRAEDGAANGTATTAQLRRVFNEVLERVGDTPLESCTIRSFLEEWLAAKVKESSTSTGKRYEKPVKDFITHLGDRARLPLRSITQADVQKWRDTEQAAGKSSVTVNLNHKVVAGALACAVRQGFLPHNPARAFGYLPEHLEKTKKLPFTSEEIQALVKAAPSRDWQGAILIGAYTGLRLGDILKLQWGSVDLSAQILKVTPKKTERHGTELAIPMHGKVEEFLLSHPAGKTDGSPVFPSLAGLVASGRSGASMQFSRIMEKAGVSAGTGRTARGEAGRNTSQRSFHSLRHGFISALANAEVGIDVRKKLAGHSRDSISLGYTHAQLERLRDAVQKL